MKAGSKYYPLYQFLKRQQQPVTLSFAEIESLLGTSLPESARRQSGWWSNRSRGALQARAWMQAGYHVTAVDLNAGQITWEKPQITYVAERVGDTIQWDSNLIKGLRRHMALTQDELAELLGVRQQTISEWERGAYLPSRATSKYLSLVAERAGFTYEIKTEKDI